MWQNYQCYRQSASTNAKNIIPTNTVSTNVMSAVSINSDNKKVIYKIDCYICHTVLLVVILLFMITVISYYYTKHRSKQKRIGALQYKIENDELKKSS